MCLEKICPTKAQGNPLRKNSFRSRILHNNRERERERNRLISFPISHSTQDVNSCVWVDQQQAPHFIILFGLIIKLMGHFHVGRQWTVTRSTPFGMCEEEDWRWIIIQTSRQGERTRGSGWPTLIDLGGLEMNHLEMLIMMLMIFLDETCEERDRLDDNSIRRRGPRLHTTIPRWASLAKQHNSPS